MNRTAPNFPAQPPGELSRTLASVPTLTALRTAPGEETRAQREPKVKDYLRAIAEGRWIVGGVAFLSLALAGAYLFLAAPSYESKTLVLVEDRAKMVASFADLSNLLGEKSPVEGEIEMIRSRTLIEAVVGQLELDIDAEPRRFPVFGGALSRRYHSDSPAPPLLGLSRFGWGGEQIQVRRLDVSDDLLDQPLSLVALESGGYRLRTEDGGLQVEGKVGRAVTAAAGKRRVELYVSEIVARPGTEFRVRKRLRADVVDEIQQELRVTEKGKKTGVLLIELEGKDPQKVAAVLSAISTNYLRQNVDRRSAEAAKMLDFLESQLPIFKSKLDTAEAAVNTFKRRARTMDVSREAEALFERSSELQKALSELELQRSELLQRFTAKHPDLVSLGTRAKTLRVQLNAIGTRMRAVPKTEADSARLGRDVKVATEMYVPLLNKAQELRMVKAGTIGNIRVLDQARVPNHPARPKVAPVLGICLLLGLAGGIAAAFVRRAFDERAQDAEEIEAGTGLPVYVTVPHSEKQVALARAAGKRNVAALPVLSAVSPEDVAIESLRSLRTSLLFTLVESQNNIVVIMSPTPAVGKSFIALNLADVFATAGKSALLVDGDLRRGQLHRHFNVPRHPGLSEMVSGAVTLDKSVVSMREGKLSLLPTGTIPPNPAEVLSSQRFGQVLKEASRRFDVVIVDTPPLMVTDSLLAARFAGVNFLVLRAGQHPIGEIAVTLKRLAQSGIQVHGAVLNDLSASRARYAGYGQQFEYPPRSE